MPSDDELRVLYQDIPADLDILITHDPVFSFGSTDLILKPIYPSQVERGHIGNMELYLNLMDKVERQEGLPRYIFNGHIHTGNHEPEMICFYGDCTTVVNVALMDEGCNDLVYKPLEIDIL